MQMTFKSNSPQVCFFSSVLSIKLYLYGEHQLKLPSLLRQIKSLKLTSCLGNLKLKCFRKCSKGFKAATQKSFLELTTCFCTQFSKQAMQARDLLRVTESRFLNHKPLTYSRMVLCPQITLLLPCSRMAV